MAREAAWTSAILEATRWLREMADVRRVVAIGIELGGLLAYHAISLGAEIDDLVL